MADNQNNLPEEETERRNDDHHDDGRPDGEALAEHAFVHGPLPDRHSRLQLHHIHIRIPLHEAKRLIHRVGLRTGGIRGEAKVDGSEFVFGEVDDARQEGAPDALAPISRQDHDILDTRLPPRRRLKDAQRGASDNMLFIVLRDENPRSRRRHRTLLLLPRDRQLGGQLLHKAQQIIDLRFGQGAKFNVSHSIWKKVLQVQDILLEMPTEADHTSRNQIL